MNAISGFGSLSLYFSYFLIGGLVVHRTYLDFLEKFSLDCAKLEALLLCRVAIQKFKNQYI